MRGSGCSIGAIQDFVQQPCSRIPHLQFHILSRHARPRSLQPQTLLRPTGRQWFHGSPTKRSWTTSLRGGLEDVLHQVVKQDGVDEITQANSVAESLSSSSSSTSDSSTYLQGILEEGHPERIYHALLEPRRGLQFVRRADDATFVEAFTKIDPRYFIDPFKEVYRFLKPSLSNDPTYRWVVPLGARMRTFASHIEEIVMTRKDAGHTLTLPIHRHLLDCARVMGNGLMAKHIFKRLMPADGIYPDLQCHNYFMEATCWSNAWSKEEQWRLRVTPRILELRGRYKRPPDLQGHRVARVGLPGDEKALRYHTLHQFKAMVAQGIEGTEHTFASLLTAMGRENDILGAKSILKSVYNIDVDLLLEIDEEEMETPTFYELDSPLRPSARLLFCLAHLFGSNNDIGLAFKLVDYVSRYYDLTIPREVWMELFEWAFVLHLRRTGAQRRQGQHLGQIPYEVLVNLWGVMTDKPYNVRPDAIMLIVRARALHKLLRLDETIEYVRAARENLDERRREAAERFDEILQLADDLKDHSASDTILPARYFDLRRKFLLECLEIDRDLQMLNVAIRGILEEDRWAGTRKEKEWERRRLPLLVEEFAEYFPNTVTYSMQGGKIELAGKQARNRLIRAKWQDQTRISGIIRGALEKDNHAALLHGLRDLPDVLKFAEDWCFQCESKGHRTEDCTEEPQEELNPLGMSGDDIVIRRSGSDVHSAHARDRSQAWRREWKPMVGGWGKALSDSSPPKLGYSQTADTKSDVKRDIKSDTQSDPKVLQGDSALDELMKYSESVKPRSRRRR